MADENIVIKVTESGTDDVTAKLDKLGASGDSASQRLIAGMSAAGAAAAGLNAALTQATGVAQQAASASQTLAAGMSAAGAAAAAAATATNTNTTAQQANTTAVTQGTAALAQQHTAVGNVTNSFTALRGVLESAAAYLSFKVFIDASDAATKIDNQLKLVTTDTQNFNDVYKTLASTAQSTGLAFADVTKTFFNLSEAAKDTNINQQQLLTTTRVLAEALFQSGASTAQASRVARDFSEAISQGTLNGRLFNAIAQQAPLLLTDLAEGLGVTRGEMEKTKSASHAAATGIKSDMGDIGQAGYERIRKATEGVKNLGDELTKLTNKRAELGSLDDPKAAKSFTKLSEEIDKTTKHFDSAKKSADSLSTSIQEKAATAAQKLTDKLNSGGLSAQQIILALNKIAPTVDEQFTHAQGTIGQAFAILNTDLILYVDGVNKATGANALFRDVIIEVGSHLNTIIPILVGIGAALAGLKLIALINEATVAVTALIAAFQSGAVIATLLNPITLILAAIAVAALLVYTNWSKIEPVVTSLATAATNFFTSFLDFIARTRQDIAAWRDDLVDKILAVLNQIENKATDLWNGFINGIHNAITAVQQFFGPLQTLWTYLSNIYNVATQAFSAASQASAASPISSTLDAGNTDTSTLFSGGAAIGRSANVPGTGGADSRLVQFMATPGERVTVQTPAQVANGVIPHFATGGTLKIPHAIRSIGRHAPKPIVHRAKIPGFAAGGFINVGNTSLGTDVTLGLSGISLKFVPSDSASVVGYNAPSTTAGGTTAATAAAVASAVAAAVATGTPTAITFTNPGAMLTTGQLAALKQFETLYNIDPFAGTDTMRAQNLKILQRLGGPDTAYDAGNGAHVISAFANVAKLFIDGTEVYKTLAQYPFPYPVPPQAGFTTTKAGLAAAGVVGLVAKAKDGLDFTVPGTGSVDSRVLSMAVSPGEQIMVRTPAQQRAAGKNGRSNAIIQNITIQASDIDSYARSKKQVLRDLATAVSKAT